MENFDTDLISEDDASDILAQLSNSKLTDEEEKVPLFMHDSTDNPKYKTEQT
jgi:hypothetical protein